MANAKFVKSARNNIYQRGKLLGTGQIDRTSPADENDKILIKKGESYYWWKFRYGSKQISKNPPKRSQLTQSAFLSSVYSIQEEISDMSALDAEDFESQKEDFISRLEELRDECQEKLDAMPEHLQETSTSGELLQNRIDELENYISNIENVSCEETDESEFDHIEDEDDRDTEIENDKESKVETAINELRALSYDGN